MYGTRRATATLPRRAMSTIPFHVPYRTGREAAYVTEVVTSGQVSGNGPFTQRCQAMLEALTGARRVLLTHSCTAALEMSAMLCDLGPGDEVIVPSFAFTSTASAFARTGASIVFADVRAETMSLDPEDVARRVTPRTRAIVPIHYAGLAADLAALQAIADAHGATLVEDAAQAVDCRTPDGHLGTFGRFGCLSFHETKNIHCGLGGALLIRDGADVERAEFVWERGTNRSQFFRGLVDKYTWVELGSSYYPDELAAAFLLAQLEGLEANTTHRNRIGDIYDTYITPVARPLGIHTRSIEQSHTTNTHGWFLVLRSEEECDALQAHLAEQEIRAYTHYVPLHTSPQGRRLGGVPGTLPVTERLAPAVLRLPVHTEMSDDDAARVANQVVEWLQARNAAS